MNLEGSGSWRILGHDGKTKATQRSEPNRILDHCVRDVDNSIAVLNQDTARQFLCAANPKEKYELFMRSTLLRQLLNEMDALQDHIVRTSGVLIQQQQRLPELKDELNEAMSELRAAQQLGRQINDAQRTVQQIQAASKDSLSAFGRSMPSLYKAIQQETRWHQKPLGPIGSFIKLEDPT